MTKIKETIQAMIMANSYADAHELVHASVGYMTKIAQGAASANLQLQDLLTLKDDELTLVIYGANAPKRVVPDFEQVDQDLAKNRKITLRMLHRRYKEQYGDQAYSYSMYCLLYRQWQKLKPGQAQSNIKFWDGERMEIDTSGDLLIWKDFTGKLHVGVLFVAAMSSSGAIYAEVFEDGKQPTRMLGTQHAWGYFGGVASKLVMDNAKPLVAKITKDGSGVQDAIKVMCSHYGAIPCPCPVRSPKSKSHVEYGVNLVQKDVIAEKLLDGGWVAEDLADLNRQIRPVIDEINRKKLTGSNESRFDKLEQEKPFLMPLPAEPFEIGEWRYVRVDARHCVKISCSGNLHRYSVPPGYVNKKVTVHLTGAYVTVYSGKDNQIIARHDRCYNDTGEKTHLLPEHMTEKEKYSRLSKASCVDALINKGLPQSVVIQFVDRAWADAKEGRRICKASEKVCKEFSVKSVSAAMQTCVENGTCTSERLRKHSLNNEMGMKQPDGQPNPDYQTPEHGNIRNNYR